MKKITLIAALAFGAMGINAQNLDLVRNGESLPDGAKIEIKEAIPEYGNIGKLDAEILIKNLSSADAEATLTITVIKGQNVQYCFGGTCAMVSEGNPTTRKGKVAAGQSVNPQVDVLGVNMSNPDYKFYSEVEYKLETGNGLKTVNVVFNYDAAVSISSVYGENNVYVADNALQYAFDKVANRSLNIYSITGSLVKSEVLDNAGSVALDNLNKGVYLYEIMENGKRIAAHKCVIR